MATYLDKGYQGSPFVSGIPLDLIMKVGAVKQEKYDRNYAAITDQYSQYANFPFLKESDKSFVLSKIGDTVNSLNSLGDQNLGDSRVYNQLMGIASGLNNDKDIYTRIANNQRASKDLRDLQDIKEKQPELYSSANERVFLRKLNAWKDNPDNNTYDARYTPYYNVPKVAQDQIDKLLQHPDVRREIEYLPDGTRRGEREIKEVTAEKIRNGLMGSLGFDEKARNQLMIDYEDALSQMNPSSVKEQISNSIGTNTAAITSYNNAISAGGLSQPQLDLAKRNISQLENANSRLLNTLNDINATGDITKYFSPQKYMSDYISGLANIHQMRQEGKLDDDFIFTEDYKLKNAKDLERWKSDLETNQKITLADAGIGTGKSKVKVNNDGTLNVVNEFEDALVDTFMNGKGQLNSNMMKSLYNGDVKTEDDGSFTITQSQNPVFLDVRPMLQASGITEDNAAKVEGLNALTNQYKIWAKNHTTTIQGISRSTYDLLTRESQMEWNNWAKQNGFVDINDMFKHKKGVSFGQRSTYERAAPMSEYINSLKGDKANEFKNKYGIDLTDPNDLSNANKVANNPALIDQISEVGTLFKNARFGRLNIAPVDGANIFIGSDGQAYTTGLATATWEQLKAALGGDPQTLLDKGIIRLTGTKTKTVDGKDTQKLYTFPISMKVTKDLASANQEYLGNHSNKTYEENLPTYSQHWNDTWTKLQSVRGIVDADPASLGGRAAMNVDNLRLPTKERNDIYNLIDYYQNILRSNPNRSSRIEALYNLQKVANWSSEDYRQAVESAKAAKSPASSGTSISVSHNNPGNIKYGAFAQRYGAVAGKPATDGGVFAVFPDVQSGLQARKDLLQSGGYKDLSVDAALKRWSNSDYGGEIIPSLANKKIRDLSSDELEKLMKAQILREDKQMYSMLYEGTNP